MKRALVGALVALLASAPAWADEEPSEAVYDALVARADAGDATVDYALLRASYTKTKHYEPYGGAARDLMLDAFKAVQAKDCVTAVAKAKEALRLNYVDFRSHAVLSDCHEQAGDNAGHDRELAIGRAIVDALMKSGDGKTPETAYRVVTVSEEYFVMGLREAEVTLQSLINHDGHVFDRLEGKTKSGEQVALFFNIDTIFGRFGN